MGFCLVCRRHMEDPFDCDCLCDKCGEERWFCGRHGCKESA